MFRQFGRIQDIIPASPSSKELPRFAIITFLYVRSATAAKNCLHQIIEQGTKIHISYEAVHKMHWFVWDWITHHPRITIPLAAAIFAVIMGTIFDPIRTWCIENKVSKRWSVESSRVIQWLRMSLIVPFRRKKGAQELAWKVDENVKKIKDWIGENQESFIVVVGPKGTAKREMVIDGVLEGRTKYQPYRRLFLTQVFWCLIVRQLLNNMAIQRLSGSLLNRWDMLRSSIGLIFSPLFSISRLKVPVLFPITSNCRNDWTKDRFHRDFGYPGQKDPQHDCNSFTPSGPFQKTPPGKGSAQNQR